MATKILSTTTDDSLQLEINNGDLQALKKIKDKWNFNSIESVVRFAIAVLDITEQGTLCEDKNGNKRLLKPTDELIKSD